MKCNNEYQRGKINRDKNFKSKYNLKPIRLNIIMIFVNINLITRLNEL